MTKQQKSRPRKSPEPEKERNSEVEINFGLGSIGFGGLFKGIGDLIELSSKLKEEGVERRGELKGLPNNVKGVYGFSIKTVVGGKPVIETFGNVKDTAKGPVVDEVREPIVDVFDEKDYVLVIAEIPGIAENNIKVEVTGDILNITANDKTRKYAKEVLLPAKVKSDSLKSSYKNGMLEIRLQKEKK